MSNQLNNTTEYPAALPQGSILAGRYIIQSVLGQGGFGITYLAEDYNQKSKAAIKEFFPEYMVMRRDRLPLVTAYSGGGREDFQYGMQCFLEEARMLAQFQGNPNIVGVQNYFEENGTAYFAMDYIEGTSLKNYLKRRGGTLEWEEAWQIMLPVMDALAAVHEKGAIHRDVAPDNIYLADDHTVKLLDFGAARYSLGDRSQSLDVVLRAGYAPREQYTRRGRQGPYTDIYSLAACFYAVLCGYLPPESLDRIEKDELVPLHARGVRLPERAEKAIQKGLAVRPEDRFQSVGEFKRAIAGTIAIPQSLESINDGTGGKEENHPGFLEKYRALLAGIGAGIIIIILTFLLI